MGLSAAPKDMVDFMLQTIKEVEKEEGLEGTAGLTEDHYQMIIFDIFSGKRLLVYSFRPHTFSSHMLCFPLIVHCCKIIFYSWVAEINTGSFNHVRSYI